VRRNAVAQSFTEKHGGAQRNFMIEDDITSKVIGSTIEVHRYLGPGLLESAYNQCLFYELKANGLHVEREKPMPIIYKDVTLDHGYKLDLVVENEVVVELKTVEAFTDVHVAQLLTYLRLGDYRLGLLINSHVSLLKNGIKRLVN
jgi:GxxExxY protein